MASLEDCKAAGLNDSRSGSFASQISYVAVTGHAEQVKGMVKIAMLHGL